MANRVSKIQQHSFIQWRYVRSDQNPADLGSRGGRVDKSAKLWWEGPAWLAEPESWPPDIVTMATSETQAEAKVVREALFVTKTEDDVLNETLEKHGYWKAIRIVAWIARFLSNCKAKSAKKSGPLTTEETETQVERWIYRVQSRFAATDKYRKTGLVSTYKRMNKGSSNAEAAFKVTIRSTFLMMIYSTRNWSQVQTRTLSTGESV